MYKYLTKSLFNFYFKGTVPHEWDEPYDDPDILLNMNCLEFLTDSVPSHHCSNDFIVENPPKAVSAIHNYQF